MGFTNNRGFASNVYADSRMITDIPDHWSMENAVSVAMTYLTVWYGLIKRAHFKKC